MAEATPNQMRIFVSHSHEDDNVCRALVTALRDAGADVWYDEQNLTSGRLGPTIERELRARPVFIVMLSPAALASQWVEDEARWAYNLMRRDPARIILPVLCETVIEDDIWLFLQDFKRIEAPGVTPFPKQERVQRTLRALALTPKGETPAPATPQSAESVGDLLTHGQALSAQQKPDEALPFFQRGVQLDPNSFDAWYHLGYTLGELGRYNEAVEMYDKALAIDPNDATIWGLKSDALSIEGRFAEGLVAAERTLALDPEEATNWMSKGMALTGLERYEEAISALERSLAIDPNEAPVWSLLADPLEALERYEEALSAYERSLALDPTPAYNWEGKARILRALGREAEAIAADRQTKKLKDAQ
jgi:tetratricopeptide (TPR) repeat protein